jgi:hypothetical protein
MLAMVGEHSTGEALLTPEKLTLSFVYHEDMGKFPSFP